MSKDAGEYIKQFDDWAREKKQIDSYGPHRQIRSSDKEVNISAGEIRWAQLGV